MFSGRLDPHHGGTPLALGARTIGFSWLRMGNQGSTA